MKIFFLVFFILIIALFLYTYRLDSVPNGLYVDEAVSGYNSYSVLKTGADEYGKAFPIAFRFFGSYSPPLYVYLSTPFIYFLDLNIFSTRILSALMGVISIFLMFIFLRNIELIKDRKIIPVLGAALLAITPWNFFFARIGYEIYLGAFLFFLSSLLIWLGFKKKSFLILGIIVLSLSTYGAHTEIYLSPLFFVLLLIFFRKEIFKDKKYLAWGVILGLIIQIPHVLILNSQAFINKNSLFYFSDILIQADKMDHIIPYPLAFALAFLREFLARLLIYFSPNSLFFISDSDPQRSLPGLSVFYFWIVVPYLTGFYVLFKKILNQSGKYILILVLSAAVPPALTGDPFSTQRALPLLFPLFIVISIGLDTLYQKINKRIFIGVFILLFLISLVLLWRSYFVLLPSERAKTWGYGTKQLAEWIIAHPEINFIIDQNRSKPLYIELAFFGKVDPKIIQSSVDPKIEKDYYNNSLFFDEYNFGNINIKRLIFEDDIYKEAILVGDEYSISEDQAKEHFLTPTLEIKDPVGNIIFKGYKTNPGLKCQVTQNYSPYCKK